MPNQRACVLCVNPDALRYLRERMALGAPLNVVSAELAQKHRMEAFGIRKAPGFTMVATHVAKHMRVLGAPSSSMPSFSGPSVPAPYVPPGDIASSIQQAALEALAKGEMRISASHALRAQEILDRRAEKQQDRELKVVLARILTREASPPPKYVGPEEDIIEGSAVEVTA